MTISNQRASGHIHNLRVLQTSTLTIKYICYSSKYNIVLALATLSCTFLVYSTNHLISRKGQRDTRKVLVHFLKIPNLILVAEMYVLGVEKSIFHVFSPHAFPIALSIIIFVPRWSQYTNDILIRMLNPLKK